jgi:hypothetical protein
MIESADKSIKGIRETLAHCTGQYVLVVQRQETDPRDKLTLALSTYPYLVTKGEDLSVVSSMISTHKGNWSFKVTEQPAPSDVGPVKLKRAWLGETIEPDIIFTVWGEAALDPRNRLARLEIIAGDKAVANWFWMQATIGDRTPNEFEKSLKEKRHRTGLRPQEKIPLHTIINYIHLQEPFNRELILSNRMRQVINYHRKHLPEELLKRYAYWVRNPGTEHHFWTLMRDAKVLGLSQSTEKFTIHPGVRIPLGELIQALEKSFNSEEEVSP